MHRCPICGLTAMYGVRICLPCVRKITPKFKRFALTEDEIVAELIFTISELSRVNNGAST